VDGLLTSTAAAAVSGELSGVGSVNGATLTSGILAPGLSTGSSAAGTLTSTANTSLDANSTLSIRIGLNNGAPSDSLTGLGGDADQLLMSGGTFSLNDTLLQLVVAAGELSAADGSDYVIVNGGAGGTGASADVFSNAPLSGDPVTFGNYTFDVLYATNAAGGGFGTGNDVDLELVAVVPEPATWASLIGGIGMLVAWQRFRRRRS